MFGAGTDYCLLLIARYREELANDTPDPMGTALRRTAPAIVSAGGIVVAVMLVLTLADYNATRWMGPVLAIGTAITVLAGVTLLPAILTVLPQRAFTHKKPVGPIWPRIGALVRRRPAMLATAVVAVLVAGALGNLKQQGTLDFSEQFRETPESVEGLRILQAKFPPGQPGPVDSARPAGDRHRRQLRAARDRPGAERRPRRVLARRQARADPHHARQDPFTELATEAIPKLRENARTFSPQAMVGGPTAEMLDSETALARDARLIIPLALALVFLIVAVLLRSLVAPIYASPP